VHFRCKWTPPWSFPRRALRRDVLSHANPTSPPSSSSTPASSSPTPASSSVAVVHLRPKVSTLSRSSRRFLSVLPFNLQFCGRSHLIPFIFSFSVRSVRAEGPPSANHRPCRPWIGPPSCIPTAGEHHPGPPCFFSLRSAARSSLWSPKPPVIGTTWPGGSFVRPPLSRERR
jgi:hypothetical protein